MQHAIGSLRAEERFSNRPMLLQLNHPNLGWAVTPEDVAAVTDERFVEVYSGNRVVPNQGDAAHPGMEAFWDRVLALRLDRGEPLLYGVACDDAHEYSGGRGSAPGRGWIMVRAGELSADAIVRAMLAGDFYASTGIRLLDLRRDAEGIALSIAESPGASYVTRFIGARRDSAGHVVLQETGNSRGTDSGRQTVRARHRRLRIAARRISPGALESRSPGPQPVRVEPKAKP
jgi:hypothetical protein